MKLTNVAKAFDKLPALDGYSGALLFRCQIGLYDDNKRDSETAERRVMSVASTVSIPSRRIINLNGTRWIVGHSNPDYFKDKTIRLGYVLTETPFLATIRTLGQICRVEAGTTAWACRVWVKNQLFTEQSSDVSGQFHIHFGATEQLDPNKIVTYAGRNYIVRDFNFGTGGTIVATCDELDEPTIELGSIVVGDFDPIQEQLAGVTRSVTVVRLRWQSLFKYGSKSAPGFGPNDMQVAISQASGVVRVGSQLTLSDGLWQIESVEALQDVWLCRATKHG